MKRIIMFGGIAQRPAIDMNAWLTRYPSVELLDIKPVQDRVGNILLFCTVRLPEDISGFEARDMDYFGFAEEAPE